jgi:signal transduction histidine kinase
LARDSQNDELLDEINKAQNIIEQLQKQQQDLFKEVEQSNKTIDRLLRDKDKIGLKLKEVSEEKKKLHEELEEEQKKSLFQQSLIGTEKEQIIGLQHQIFHSASRINRNLKLLLKTLDTDLLSDKQKKYISIIFSETDKVSSIAKFVTKANFNLTARDIKEDFIQFIQDYINELYLSKNSVVDSNLNIVLKCDTTNKFIIKMKPLEITTMIDNFIQNAEKANAKRIEFTCKVLNNTLELIIKDDGKGIQKSKLHKIFDLGYTTTEGSGIGLYIVKKTIEKLQGSIEVSSEENNGTEFTIRLKQ